MLTHTARYLNQGLSPVSPAGHLALMTDLSRDPVFLRGRVTNGPAFAAAMLILGKIVKASARQGAKDHSAYQEWVQGEYFEEIKDVQIRRLAQLPKLLERDAELRRMIKEIGKEINEASNKLNDWQSIRKFWNWLYDHNRAAWIIIDPIVSVQPDATFFEGFSIDESIYARVKLPSNCIDTSDEIRPGTTNIDFSLGLDKEFSRVRTYRALDLVVGSDAVTVETDIGSAVEKKIELPESWVRGLLEVQSALAITSVKVNVSPEFVSEIISRLEEEREKHGPRSLRFKLQPGAHISVVMEPWGDVITDPSSCYAGEDVREVRVWGRRRLLLLKDILPDASSVRIDLIDSGMPSFWTINVDDIELQVGLSGWTNLDWASRARFAAFMPAGDVTEHQLARAAALLKTQNTMSAEKLAADTELPIGSASATLRQLCVVGKAMFDNDLNAYRWRELYPEFDLDKLDNAGLEERKGLDLFREGAVTIEQDAQDGGSNKITATVQDKGRESTEAEIDMDDRVVYAECTCPHFRFHKLREGPCRHMVAVALQWSRRV
jgi:hypothetical protein